MLIKTSDLTGPALDWAVAKCSNNLGKWVAPNEKRSPPTIKWECVPGTPRFSTNWAQGGPIIDREFITIGPYHGTDGKPTGMFQAYIGWDRETLDPLFQSDGPTPLIAAMRCYVASKLGDTVEVPDELIG